MRRGWMPGLLCLLLFATGCATGSATAWADAEERGFLFGMALEGGPITSEQLRAEERDTGLPIQLAVFFLQWPEHPEAVGFPRESLENIHRLGALPCITWEPMHYTGDREIMIPAQRILSGGYDLYIRHFAQEAARWSRPLLLRFGHEMNIERYHWGGSREEYGPESPGLYARMFRYVADIFRKEGADNVMFVFCPNAESVPNTSYDSSAGWNQVTAYYPGDSYVDVLGMDGYNWGTSRTVARHDWKSSFLSFERIFGKLYQELRFLSPDKPLLVFETASVPMGGDKSAWIREAVRTALDWRLSGLVWFQADKELDWRIQAGTDGSYLRAFRRAMAPFPSWAEGEIEKKP